MTETPNPDNGAPVWQPNPMVPDASHSDPTTVVARAGSPADDQKTQQIAPLPGQQPSGWAPPASTGAPQHPAPPGYPGPTGAYPGAPADAAATQAYSAPPPLLPPPPQHPAGAQTDPGGTASSSKTKKLILGGVAVLVIAAAVVAVLGFWKPGFFWIRTLDVATVQTGVQQVLVDPESGFGATDVTDVRCNDGQNLTIETVQSFTCAMKIGGTDRTVTVTFLDNAGTYGVGAPQ